MSKDRSHYDKGKEDALTGKYDPPHERIEDLIGHLVGAEGWSDRDGRESYEHGRAVGRGEEHHHQVDILKIKTLLTSIAEHEQSIQKRLDAIDRKLGEL